MKDWNAVRVDLVREDLVIRFGTGETALLRLQDIYALAVERQAFVDNSAGDDDSEPDCTPR